MAHNLEGFHVVEFPPEDGKQAPTGIGEDSVEDAFVHATKMREKCSREWKRSFYGF